MTLDVGQDLLDILKNEIDADGDRPDQNLEGRAADNSTVTDEIEAMEMFQQFGMDQWSGHVNDMVAALNLARSTEVKPMHKHISLARISDNCCADADEVVDMYCSVHWCGLRGGTARQSLTRLPLS